MTILVAEHLGPGEHLEINTLQEALRAVGVPLGGRMALGLQVGAGTRLEVKTPAGPLTAMALAGPSDGPPLLASDNVAEGQMVSVETPRGTLALVGWSGRVEDDTRPTLP